jgi:hypothetical protein
MDKLMDDSTVATLCIFTLITTNCTVHYRRSAHCNPPLPKQSSPSACISSSPAQHIVAGRIATASDAPRPDPIRFDLPPNHPLTKSDSCRPKPPPTTMSR